MRKHPSCEPEQTPLPAWSIYKLAARCEWLGIIEAPNAKAAIEAAAKEFETDARRLLAVWQRPWEGLS
jgi:Ser/Thr protein kinase RdoA (MazF antagonist)